MDYEQVNTHLGRGFTKPPIEPVWSDVSVATGSVISWNWRREIGATYIPWASSS